MAKNIGTFTAAGVGLDESTKSIKGIANLAALSGSNSQQASTAMYQLSQAISSGKVGLQDWNSVVNAGMGGAVFQKSLMRTAENMGAIEKGAVKIDKATGKATINGESFRNSIMAKPGEESWLTSDVLVNTLGQLTGDMTDAELAAQGFTQEQIKAIQRRPRRRKMPPPRSRRFRRSLTWRGRRSAPVGPNFPDHIRQLRRVEEDLHRDVELHQRLHQHNAPMLATKSFRLGKARWTGSAVSGPSRTRSKVSCRSSRRSRTPFREIFPPTTGKQLFEMTKAFAGFAKSLTIDPATAENIKRTFAGIFAVFDIARHIIGGVVGVIFDLLGAVGKGSGGFLSFTGGIGDFLVSVDAALTKGGALTDFFKGLETIIKAPLSLLGKLASAIVNLFQPSGGGQTGGGFAKELDEFGRALTPVERLINRVKDAWNTLSHAFADAKTALEPWFSSFVDKLRGLGDILADAFGTMDFDKIMGALQTGFIGGIFLVLKKALGDGLPSIFGDAFEGVNSVMKGLTGNLEAMQKNIQANTLLKIGAAVVVLAGGIYILSTIDGDDLSKAMTAVAVGLGELTAAMKLLTTGTGKLGFLQLAPIAGALIGLAIAVTILAGAVKIFSTMKWEDIGKGLAGVAGSLGAIALAMKFMPATLPLSAAGLVLIGVALNAIALALKQFGSMKLEEIAKGVFAVVEALAGIALGVSMMPPTLPLTAAGLILMGIALNAIGVAIGTMGSMDFLTIVKGLGTMMVAIAGIGLAVSLIPPTIALTAVGLLLVGQAMVVVAAAIAILGNLSVGTLIKGIVGLAGALIVLAAGLTLMIVSLPGALALLVAAGALAVLAPVLGVLGTMKWSTIFKGLAAMALVMVTIGVAGLIAAPALLLLGVALIPLGLGFILVAKGAKIFASALALLGDQGQKSVAVFIAALTGFIALLPNIIVGLIKDLLGVVDQIAVLAPKVVVALGVIIDTIIAFVIESAPKLAMAIGILVDSIIEVLLTNSPKIIAAGFKLLTNLLAGISQNIGRVTNKVSEVIVKFLSALTANAGKLVDAGAKTLVAFVQGITNNIPKVVTAVTNMVTKFIAALAGALSKIVGAGQDLILKLIGAIAGFTPKMVAKGTEIIISFLDGHREGDSPNQEQGALAGTDVPQQLGRRPGGNGRHRLQGLDQVPQRPGRRHPKQPTTALRRGGEYRSRHRRRSHRRLRASGRYVAVGDRASVPTASGLGQEGPGDPLPVERVHGARQVLHARVLQGHPRQFGRDRQVVQDRRGIGGQYVPQLLWGSIPRRKSCGISVSRSIEASLKGSADRRTIFAAHSKS
jgi:tape measure domain-containing protein